MSERGLICMGRDVFFVLRGGREVSARRRRDGMLYDSSGYYWPKCSLLVAPFEQGRDTCDVSKARDFFGRRVDVLEGRVPQLPPKDMHAWRAVGEVDQVFYDRAGKHDGPFRHKFNSPHGMFKLVALFKKRVAESKVILYSLNGCYRLELPRGCIVDDRGFVLP